MGKEVGVVMLLVLGCSWLCDSVRLREAEDVFPFDDLGVASPDGYAVFGTSSKSQLGWRGHNLGDINGDGLDDLILGQHKYGAAGRALVVFGDDDRSLMTADTAGTGSRGFHITSDITGVWFGYSLASGDYNNDGKTDILITGLENTESAVVVVIWGRAHDAWDDIVVSSTMDSSVGIVYTSEDTGSIFGDTVAHLGDFNGDGFDDFAVNAAWGDVPWGDTGRVYVVFGGSSLSSGILNETNSLRITGPQFSAVFGFTLAASDFNNDSLPDLLVSARFMDPSYLGRVYVIFGNESHGIGDMSMTGFTSGDSTGMYIEGEVAFRILGLALDGGCDVNNDGIEDILIGSGANPEDLPGIAVVLFGKNEGFETMNVGTLTPQDGFVVSGIDPGDDEEFGERLGFLGYVNDDLYGDYYVTHKDQDSNYAVTVFYGNDEASNFTILEGEPHSHEITETFFAFNAGNHLGNGTTSIAFTNYAARSLQGTAYIFKDFASYFITASPTTSPTSSPTMMPTMSPSVSPTTTPTTRPTVSPSASPTNSPTVSPSLGPSASPVASPTNIPTARPSMSPTRSPTETFTPTMTPSVSPSVFPTKSPSVSPTSTPTEAPSTSPSSAPTLSQCDVSITTTGGAGLTWDLTDDEGDEEIASGDFGGDAMDFTLLASEEYLLFLSSDTVPAGTSITVTVNGQDTVIPLEQGLTTSTEIAGVTCEAISNKIASIDSAYSSTSVLLALHMAFI